MFNQDDFLLLESIILKMSGERIKSKVEQFGTEEDRYFISHRCILLMFSDLCCVVVKVSRMDFSLRASDLVMKVDALLSSQPKGEARVEYGFADDRHRYINHRCT